MADTLSFKRLILRAVLRQVSPMVIRLVAVSDQLQLVWKETASGAKDDRAERKKVFA
jgi:hypothetical protein